MLFEGQYLLFSITHIMEFFLIVLCFIFLMLNITLPKLLSIILIHVIYSGYNFKKVLEMRHVISILSE